MQLPERFEEILKKDKKLEAIVKLTVANYNSILVQNNLYFFPEYTDHGIEHIESVLKACEDIITDDTYKNILNNSPLSITSLILAVILHDIGMHITFEGFQALLKGRNNHIRIVNFDKLTWKELWIEYINEARRFGDGEKKNIFGDINWEYENKDFENLPNVDSDNDKKLIGEFIRRHHTRLAHEIALIGFPTATDYIPFANDIDYDERDLIGLIARSHGIEVRATFDYLQKRYSQTWRFPYNIELFFLMIVIRIADYLQIDQERIDRFYIKLKTFSSPISQIEHYKHLDTKYITQNFEDPESLSIHAKPRNSVIYNKLIDLFADIQFELDKSWAILGEIYGTKERLKQPFIKYRRIKSNLDNLEEFSKNVNYIPQKIKFNVANDLSKLLIGPLYGNDPKYGIRELIQNAVDACREREYLESNGYSGEIYISFYKENKQLYFSIEDNGIGMPLNIVLQYFLSVGSSLRKSDVWKRDFLDDDGKSKIQRSGKFGIGVLAAFLLGEKIIIETRDVNSETGYSFQTSLDTEQIEIVKKDIEKIGTKIIIPISEKTADLLKTNPYRPSSINFYHWYKLSSPKVIYQDSIGLNIPKELQVYPPSKKELPIDWSALPQKSFEEVHWKYEKNSIFLCNGILIPDWRWDQNEGFSKPTISVFDFDGKLSLTLNRNKLDGSLQIGDELFNDVSRDIIAKILTTELEFPFLDNKLHIKKIQEFKHPAINTKEILYKNGGFILDFETLIDKNVDDNLIHISLTPNENSPNFEVFDAFYKFHLNDNLNLYQYRDAINKHTYSSGISAILNSKIIFSRLFESDKSSAVAKTIKKNYTILSTKGQNTHILYKNECIPHYTINNIKNILPYLNYITECKMQDYSESYPYYNYYSRYKKFNLILSEYFENITIIPYDMEERRELFKDVFKELKPYMKKYIKT